MNAFLIGKRRGAALIRGSPHLQGASRMCILGVLPPSYGSLAVAPKASSISPLDLMGVAWEPCYGLETTH